DPKADAVHGVWERRGDVLALSPAADQPGRLQLPFAVEGVYDLQVRFVRTGGNEAVHVLLPVGNGKRAVLSLGAWAGAVSGLDFVAGGRLSGATAGASRPGKLDNGHEYTLLVHVHPSGGRPAGAKGAAAAAAGQMATIFADLDG